MNDSAKRVIPSDAARVLGRFNPDGPTGYRSSLGGPTRPTRAEAVEDYTAQVESRMTGTVQCDDCGATHIAEYHHNGRPEWDDADTRYFAVVCTVDHLTGYYAESRVTFA